MESRITSWTQLTSDFPGISNIATLEQKGQIEFRPYQALAMLAFILYGRGVLRLATGSGKTLLASGIAGALNVRTLGVIHGNALLEQTREEFAKFLARPIGIIQQKTTDIQDITLASVDTLRSRLKTGDKAIRDYLNSVEFLFLDECHRSSANGWQQVAGACSAPYRLGLSGTPFKNSEFEDSKLMSVCGPLICDIGADVLQQLGFVSTANLTIHKYNAREQEKKLKAQLAKENKGITWQAARKNLLVENTERTKIIAQDLARHLKNTDDTILVLTGNSVELGANILRAVRKLGYGDDVVRFVSGQHTRDTVADAFADLKSGALRCLIVTKIADEGIDIPSIKALFIVGGGKSFVQTIQRIGRGLRKSGSKSALDVHEYWITGNKYLARHDSARLRIYEQENLFDSITYL